MADRGFQRLAERHHFLMHGVMGRRLPALCGGVFIPVNSVFLNLAGGDFREAQMAEEGDQVDSRTPVQALDVVLAALTLRDDVVFAEVLVRCCDFKSAASADFAIRALARPSRVCRKKDSDSPQSHPSYQLA